METTTVNTAPEQPNHIPLSQTTPQHQYLALPDQPQAIPTVQTASPTLAAGFFGFVVAGTGSLGSNLHQVQSGEMSMNQAVVSSVVKGAAGGVAAASATAAATTLTKGGVAGLAVTIATATGVSYLLGR